MIYNWDSTL